MFSWIGAVILDWTLIIRFNLDAFGRFARLGSAAYTINPD